MNYSNPKFWKGINAVKIKDVCYKGLSKPVRAVKQVCPNHFDGFKCWKEAMVGQTVQEPCPDYVIGFDLMKSASKTCGSDGVWLDPTNYTSCLTSDEDLGVRNIGHFIYLGSYGLASLIMVMMFLIFGVFRKNDRWFRVKTHVNFFFANLFKNIMSMTWYINVIRDPTVVLFNPIWCQILNNLTNYSNLASHFWLFNEALYIYLEVAIVQSRMKKSLLLFTIIGWVMPAVIVAVYSMIRIFYLEDTESSSDKGSLHIIPKDKTITWPYDQMSQSFSFLIALFAVQDYLLMMQQSRQYALNVTFQIGSAFVIILKVLISATNICFTNEDLVTSSGQRQEDPEVEIPMTDMRGKSYLLLHTLVERGCK
ncbi:unnamed protein product [Pieris macdunnoughi]|uniref:Uncharacterized protein n=1 Tax=Pieris macdunnoughi TaxID=345717 RepID=A0A821LKB1_9NEOP|nr:unnamed protein product [Pieris macdunnoughi]